MPDVKVVVVVVVVLVNYMYMVTLLFQLVVNWTGTGWCENSTRWKSCKPVRTRGRVA